MALYMAERRKKRKADLTRLLGGKCVRCGATDHLEIDHKNAKEKAFSLSGKGLDRSWQTILQESKKCQLLCHACHILKSKESGDNPGGHNKGIDKYGEPIPEHGHESRYKSGCRCLECRRAQYEAKIRRGDITGKRKTYGFIEAQIEHGTRKGYLMERRKGFEACAACKSANAAYKREFRKRVDPS